MMAISQRISNKQRQFSIVSCACVFTFRLRTSVCVYFTATSQVANSEFSVG